MIDGLYMGMMGRPSQSELAQLNIHQGDSVSVLLTKKLSDSDRMRFLLEWRRRFHSRLGFYVPVISHFEGSEFIKISKV